MKIISSVGPNAKDFNIIKGMIEGGSSILRFNMSHGNYETIEPQLDYIRKNYPKIDIMMDLRGNKIRVDKSYEGERKVSKGEIVRFCSKEYYSRANDKKMLIPLDFQGEFSRLYGVRDIFMKDGTMSFKVHGINGETEAIKAETVNGGVVRAGKGVNAVNIDRENQKLTCEDKRAIEWCLKHGADIILLSYVSSASEIREAKGYISYIRKREGIVYKPRIWAKIECREGIENVDEIGRNCDGIVIGRGDLSCEIPMTGVPFIEDIVIDSVRRMRKDVAVATHILDSMKYKNEPELNEMESIYRFVQKGVNAFILCGETNIGKNPVESVVYLKELLDLYYENTL